MGYSLGGKNPLDPKPWSYLSLTSFRRDLSADSDAGRCWVQQVPNGGILGEVARWRSLFRCFWMWSNPSTTWYPTARLPSSLIHKNPRDTSRDLHNAMIHWVGDLENATFGLCLISLVTIWTRIVWARWILHSFASPTFDKTRCAFPLYWVTPFPFFIKQ